MAKQLPSITQDLKEFIAQQKIFFVGTARADGRVNISPKGMDSFRVLNENTIIWLNGTGSGNETAAHIMEHNRMTILFCSFDQKPLILRLYGKAIAYHANESKFDDYLRHFPPMSGSRQVFEMQIEMVQTSCGYAVPFMEFKEERTVLEKAMATRGKEGVQQYWKDKNGESIDGFKTTFYEK